MTKIVRMKKTKVPVRRAIEKLVKMRELTKKLEYSIELLENENRLLKEENRKLKRKLSTHGLGGVHEKTIHSS
jgi:hypothetical protein